MRMQRAGAANEDRRSPQRAASLSGVWAAQFSNYIFLFY